MLVTRAGKTAKSFKMKMKIQIEPMMPRHTLQELLDANGGPGELAFVSTTADDAPTQWNESFKE